uniref:Ig-like domain-containing protein n=1 Tax=Oncorhynchus kisutch TaxID=8019 RepID=A0A8C7FCB2_ONCKI
MLFTQLALSHYHTVVQRPVSDPVHPGHSVTLQCTVLSETCTGEHSVCWFRAGSGESHPGVIYTSGNKSGECKKSPETPSPTHSCVFSLSKNNLSPSDAVTYYCAVATCGEILVGNGTKLDAKCTFMTTINVKDQMGRSCFISMLAWYGFKSNQIVFVTYTWLADVNASVAKCLCF